MYNRDVILRNLSAKYYKFLSTIDWDDEEYVDTLKECRGTYLTFAFLTLLNSRGGYKKYRNTSNYISENAYEMLKDKKTKGLRFEHMIPKQKYIQDELESLAKSKQLGEEKVYSLLNKYWYIATITVEEDRALNKASMPDEWDGLDHMSRYTQAGLAEKLIVNSTELLL